MSTQQLRVQDLWLGWVSQRPMGQLLRSFLQWSENLSPVLPEITLPKRWAAEDVGQWTERWDRCVGRVLQLPDWHAKQRWHYGEQKCSLTYSHTYTHAHMHTHTHTHTHTHIFTHVHTHICTHTYTNTHMHTHVCMHAHTHMTCMHIVHSKDRERETVVKNSFRTGEFCEGNFERGSRIRVVVWHKLLIRNWGKQIKRKKMRLNSHWINTVTLPFCTRWSESPGTTVSWSQRPFSSPTSWRASTNAACWPSTLNPVSTALRPATPAWAGAPPMDTSTRR